MDNEKRIELSKLIHEIILTECGYQFDYKGFLQDIKTEIKAIVDAELESTSTYFEKFFTPYKDLIIQTSRNQSSDNF